MKLYIDLSSDKSKTPKGKGGDSVINAVLSVGNKKVATVAFLGEVLRIYTDHGVHTIELQAEKQQDEQCEQCHKRNAVKREALCKDCLGL